MYMHIIIHLTYHNAYVVHALLIGSTISPVLSKGLDRLDHWFFFMHPTYQNINWSHIWRDEDLFAMPGDPPWNYHLFSAHPLNLFYFSLIVPTCSHVFLHVFLRFPTCLCFFHVSDFGFRWTWLPPGRSCAAFWTICSICQVAMWEACAKLTVRFMSP